MRERERNTEPEDLETFFFFFIVLVLSELHDLTSGFDDGKKIVQ